MHVRFVTHKGTTTGFPSFHMRRDQFLQVELRHSPKKIKSPQRVRDEKSWSRREKIWRMNKVNAKVPVEHSDLWPLCCCCCSLDIFLVFKSFSLNPGDVGDVVEHPPKTSSSLWNTQTNTQQIKTWIGYLAKKNGMWKNRCNGNLDNLEKKNPWDKEQLSWRNINRTAGRATAVCLWVLTLIGAPTSK